MTAVPPRGSRSSSDAAAHRDAVPDGHQEPLPEVSRRAFVEQVMGMPVSIHVRGDVRGELDRPVVATAVEQAFGVLRRVDSVFSTWRDDSDLMRLRRGDLAPAQAHPWLAEVEQLCVEAEGRTGGLFSASFGQTATRARSGVSSATAAYDPTGLVKGWAVERAAMHLRHVAGISWCVNAGGDLLAGVGHEASASTWRIGIEDPRVPGVVAATVPLRVGGLATSGTAARGAHVLDPRTGAPVTRDGSATVWGPTLLWADVWATALFVDPRAAEAALVGADPAYRSLLL
jgi:thiamine biosynthesis lipoprotein